MSEHRVVTDEEILAGFQSLHEAIALGFARVDDRFREMDRRFDSLEARMLRRFDDVDAHFHEVDRRLKKLEERRAR
jgi:hypothetical protein